jgi:hypothetical protein
MNIYYPDPNDDFFVSLKEWCKSNPLPPDLKAFSISDNFWLGKKHSEETKKLLSVRKSGKNNPMYQKDFSEEHRRKLALAQLGKPLSEAHKQAISKTKTGVPRSEETKRKISEARKRQAKKQ